MKLVVGLGNPGKEYELTRHNAGFMFLDFLAEKNGFTFSESKKFFGEIAEFNQCMYLKPLTFMNRSGLAVKSVMDYYKIAIQDVLVVYDDKDLLFKIVRLRKNGASAGHKGMQSIIDSLDTDDIARIKIGVDTVMRREHRIDTAEFVLSRFSKDEIGRMEEVLIEAYESYLEWNS
jgi:PTH1 family peptidyl-tRNA hydrolase